MFIKYCAFFLKDLRIAKIYIFVIPPKTKLMPPILVSWEAPFRKNILMVQWGPYCRMTLRLVLHSLSFGGS